MSIVVIQKNKRTNLDSTRFTLNDATFVTKTNSYLIPTIGICDVIKSCTYIST